MLVMIDNYDSFTYNLVQYLRMLGTEISIFRNDEVTIEHIEEINPEGLVISPGPGRPSTAGISMKVIKHFAGKIPILGVCLGHQSIAEAFGGKIISAKKIMHGKTSLINSDNKKLFTGMNKPFQAMRYHSLAVDETTLPDCFEISATTDDGEIMGLRHKDFLIEGIQFHPESIMTPVGKRLLRNFLKLCRGEIG